MCEDWMVECPLCSMFLNIAVWVSLMLIIWCASDSTAYNGTVSPQSLTALPVVLFLLLYACYLTECYFSSTRKHLSKVLKRETIDQLLERLVLTRPTITFNAVCWHYETKTRVVPRVDRRGKTQMQTETYREKVVTLTNKEQFNFDKWEDVTIKPANLGSYKMAVISLTKSFTFKDSSSKSLFTNLSCGFQARHRHVDKNLDYDEQMTLEGFSHDVIAYVNLEERNKWMNVWVFWLCSIFLVSWLFRRIVSRQTVHCEIDIVKQIEYSPV